MRGVLLMFGVAVLLLVGATAAVFIKGLATAEISLTLILITGVVALLAALGGLAAMLRQWGLIDRREALALPPGSIRAVIALGLVLIFAMVSVFLVGNSQPQTARSTGLSSEQAAALPAERIVTLVEEEDGSFSAVLQVPRGSADDLSQQLMTVLGTLVTAVVAFYFGAAAPSAKPDDATVPPTLDPETGEAIRSAEIAAADADVAAANAGRIKEDE